MRPDDFFVEDTNLDSFGEATRRLDITLLEQLRRGPAVGRSDVEVAVPLARMIHDDLERYGTGSNEEMTEQQMRTALLALLAHAKRLGVDAVEVPFRDFTTFRSWWIRNGARGSWQARRDLLSSVFDSLHDRLEQLEHRTLASTLIDPITPHGRTGWPAVDVEIGELRRHFLTARTPQDYRNVGLDCVSVTEALSRHVYDPARHLRDGEEEPPVGSTKQRLERFVEDAAPGRDNAALWKLARASIEFAQDVKHRATPTRREAGIAADAVIQLSNLLRRLDTDI